MIGDDGIINVDGNPVDVLRIVDFPRPYQLNKVGDGLYTAEPGTEQRLPADQQVIRQGFLEQSNVEVVQEMVDIIKIARDFESNQKSINMQDETVDKAVNEVGRVK